MSRCVPSWDLKDVNPNHDAFRLEYEVAELKWENGQLAMHELGSRRRVPSKYMWEKARAAETLEAIVNQAYCKTQVAADDDDLVPWLSRPHIRPAAAAGSAKVSTATMTSDALVPSYNNRTDMEVRSGQAGCSTCVGSCSGAPSPFMGWSVSDAYDGDLDGGRLTSTATGSPENTGSGRDLSKSTSPDDSSSHPRTQREETVIKEKERLKAKSSVSNKRRRTPATHNQSERKRRDKINERMKTLQKLVPNSSKTDKVSMLEEIIEYVKQLQAYVHMISRTNMSPMMMPLAMQQQQMQMSMINSMGMGMGMGIGMGMNTIGFHPSTFMHMPLWSGHSNNPAVNSTALTTDPTYTFLGYQPKPTNMDAYNRMATLYQHM